MLFLINRGIIITLFNSHPITFLSAFVPMCSDSKPTLILRRQRLYWKSKICPLIDSFQIIANLRGSSFGSGGTTGCKLTIKGLAVHPN